MSGKLHRGEILHYLELFRYAISIRIMGHHATENDKRFRHFYAALSRTHAITTFGH
jgi:hypothetical protein